MAYLLGYLAEKERFVVESIADGRKAVERIDSGDAVDLVLLDVMLPYTDGFELLERLRAHEAWKRVPVIILTSRTREHAGSASTRSRRTASSSRRGPASCSAMRGCRRPTSRRR